MSETKPAKRGRPPKPELKRSDIQGAKYLTQILDLLRPLHGQGDDPKRNLHYDEFCAWLLLYFFTPAIDSLRGLQQASQFASIRRKLGLPRFSLGSFSESGSLVFDPALLASIIEQIGACLADIEPDERLRALDCRPTAVDGTLLHALPKMVWALWVDAYNHAAKMHLQFDILTGAPHRATVTEGNAGETAQLRQTLEPGRLYVNDRGYFEYDLMADILAAGSSFVVRAKDNIAHDVVRENPIPEEAARQGIVSDQIVRAGSRPTRDKIDRELRLVRIHVTAPETSQRRPNRVDSKTKLYRSREANHTLLLLTDRLDLDVSIVALLYFYRWQVELFFRWFKKVLQAEHLLALSQNGMTIVIYCALIASMLIVLWTGCKPTKRTFEALCFYFTGWIDDEDLEAHLARLASSEKIQ